MFRPRSCRSRHSRPFCSSLHRPRPKTSSSASLRAVQSGRDDFDDTDPGPGFDAVALFSVAPRFRVEAVCSGTSTTWTFPQTITR